ncbi:hypothetical protein [Pontibacter actiniarum]|nr:hypothetical protein [Pontibacter actiniarum]
MIPPPPDFLQIHVAEEGRLLHSEWLRSTSSPEYRTGLCYIQRLIIQRDINLWLVDSRKLAHITFEDQQWLKRELVPGLLHGNLSKVGRVVQPDVFTYISFEQVIEKAQSEYSLKTQIEQFTSIEAALSWLFLQD